MKLRIQSTYKQRCKKPIPWTHEEAIVWSLNPRPPCLLLQTHGHWESLSMCRGNMFILGSLDLFQNSNYLNSSSIFNLYTVMLLKQWQLKFKTTILNWIILRLIIVLSLVLTSTKTGIGKTPVTPEWRPYSLPTAF